MYVCICKAITDHDIREAAQNGASSVRELRDTLGVASCCGKCARHARAVLHTANQEAPQVQRLKAPSRPLQPITWRGAACA